MNERDLTQEEIDDQIDGDDDAGVCHHGVGFDETCDRCDEEIKDEDMKRSE